MKTLLRYLAAVISIVVVAGALLAFTPLGERPLAALLPVGDVETVDFAALTLKDTPNQFLICPPDTCGAEPHARSPVFDVSIERLEARWREVLAAQPRVEILASNEDDRQYDYVQRSARFRFPDIVTVRLVALSPSRSTLAVYSRSIYGKSDFDVNRRRIDAWLALLRAGL